MQRFLSYPIGLVPAHVFRRATPPGAAQRGENESNQSPEAARRNAAVAEYLRQRAGSSPSPQGGGEQALVPALPPKSLPLSSGRKAGGEMPPHPHADLRFSLMRKLMQVTNSWRACEMRICRRHRTCASAALQCASLPPRPRASAREPAAVAGLQRTLARRRAEPDCLEEK